jgi:hypothetical protein
MSIVEGDKIDMVLTDKKKTHAILVIADHLDWQEDEGEHLVLLQHKINAYIYFIESGQFEQSRPDLAGLPVIIQIAAKFPPSEEGMKLCRLFGKVVGEMGSSLELEVPSSGAKIRFDD